MTTIDPFNAVSAGAKLNPVATKNLIFAAVLLAVVALGKTLAVDPMTALLGAIVVIAAAVILAVAVCAKSHRLAGWRVQLVRYCLFLFCAVTLTVFTAWSLKFPRPLGCLVRPACPCAPAVEQNKMFSSAQWLRQYLYPDDKSGDADQERLGGLNWKLASIGNPYLPPEVLLTETDYESLRQSLVDALDVKRIVHQDKFNALGEAKYDKKYFKKAWGAGEKS